MPNIGMPNLISWRITGTAYSPVAAGSPGPFEKIPSGLWRSTSSALAVAGTTVTLQRVGEAAEDVVLGAEIHRYHVALQHPLCAVANRAAPKGFRPSHMSGGM